MGRVIEFLLGAPLKNSAKEAVLWGAALEVSFIFKSCGNPCHFLLTELIFVRAHFGPRLLETWGLLKKLLLFFFRKFVETF